MALPSARRPVIVEEEIKVMQEESQNFQKKLKIKVEQNSEYEKFQETMGKWYKNLKKSERSKLTPKMFKRRAVYILAGMGMIYDKLPKDWVSTLISKNEIKLYQKKKKPVDVKPIVSTGDFVDGSSLLINKDLEIKANADKDSGSAMDVATTSKLPTRPCKKFIDMTNKPPPKEWLEAYIKGIHLPRELTVFSVSDKTYLFYDYAPKFKIEERNLEAKVHNRNSFNWFQPKDIKEPRLFEDKSSEEESDKD